MPRAHQTTSIVGCIILMAGSPGLSAEFAAGNLGSVQCDHYLDILRQTPDKEALYYAWAQGFMVAINQSIINRHGLNGADVLHDPDKQRAYLRFHCKANPQSKFGDAVNALFGTQLPIIENQVPPPASRVR